MRQILRIAVFVGLGILTSSPVLGVPTDPILTSRSRGGSVTTRFTPMIEAIEQEMRDLEIPGAAVAVIEGGEVTFAQGFGRKHPQRAETVQSTTLFRIGSVTKTLTAIGLLQWVDAGVVDMNAPITDYLPDFYFVTDANWAPSIRVRDLLTHQSAMADYLEVDSPDFKDDGALARFFMDSYPENPSAYLMAPAGRMFNYTNPGYMLAGLVTEVVSGRYYRQYLSDHVLGPLGMDRTFFLPEEVAVDGDYAYGKSFHWETGESIIVEPNTYANAWARPAGYGFSSVLDLAKLVQFLRVGNPEVLSETLHLAMQTPQVDMQMFLDLLHYGYGLMIQEGGFYQPGSTDFHRLRLVSHGGDIYGYAADMMYVPELDFGFVALTNATYAHLNRSFTVALSSLCTLPAPEPLPSLAMSAADYGNYHGHYHDVHAMGDIWVRANGKQLQVQIPALDEMGLTYQSTLQASSPDNFIFNINSGGPANLPISVTFIRDEEGRSEYFRTRGFVAALLSKDVPEPDRGGRRRTFSLVSAPPRLELIAPLPGPQFPFIIPPVD